jgi:hypothetical protein
VALIGNIDRSARRNSHSIRAAKAIRGSDRYLRIDNRSWQTLGAESDAQQADRDEGTRSEWMVSHIRTNQSQDLIDFPALILALHRIAEVRIHRLSVRRSYTFRASGLPPTLCDFLTVHSYVTKDGAHYGPEDACLRRQCLHSFPIKNYGNPLDQFR